MNPPNRTRYMLDANAFDYVLDHRIDPKAVRRLGELYITTVQHGELLSVPDPGRRRQLLRVLSDIDPTVRPAFPEDGRLRDAAIGEVAGLEGCTLVTEDKGFRRRALEAGRQAISCAEAFAGLDVSPERRHEERS